MVRLFIRGCSSDGRAPALQAGGQEFDSPHLHHGVSLRKRPGVIKGNVEPRNLRANSSAG